MVYIYIGIFFIVNEEVYFANWTEYIYNKICSLQSGCIQQIFVIFFKSQWEKNSQPPLSSNDFSLWWMVISKNRHYVCISLGKKTVCLQINAEVSSALHQLCPPKQPVKAACEVCEGADSDEPQQCTCKCVFLLTTCIFLHKYLLYQNSTLTSWCHFL